MFGYKCQECGRGVVQATSLRDYEAKFEGSSLAIPEAIVGVCDACGAQHFSAAERKRWRRLFEENRESKVSTHVILPQSVHRKLQHLKRTRKRTQSDIVAELIRKV